MKKILVFLPSGVGGAERVGTTVGKLLANKEHNVSYVIMGDKQSEINTILPSEDFCNRYYLKNDNLRWFRINCLIRNLKADVVFAPCRALSRDLILATKFMGLKCRVIVRSDNPLKTLKPLLRRQIKFTFRFADIVIAQQEEMRQEIINEYPVPAHKVIALQNPIDFDCIKHNASQTSPYSDGDDVIRYIWVGRFRDSGTKGQDVLAKAFSLVYKRNPKARLYYLGGYDEKSDYFQNIRNILDETGTLQYVTFVGFEPNPYKWVKHADCFVLPSRVEGLPNALIEAMYLGKPVVSTRCQPIIDRMVEDGVNGYRVEVEDYKSMAEAMIKAVDLDNCKMIYRSASNDDFVKLFE